MNLKNFCALSVLFISLFCTHIYADEGMWTFDNIPVEKIYKKYNFKPNSEWLTKVRLACIRLEDRGSGSFISPDGLMITNHHVALKQIQKLSDKDNDYVKNGFYAKNSQEELSCKDLEANVLVNMENVTEKVIPVNKEKGEYTKKLKQNIALLEKQNTEKTGLKSSVVTLYNGGEYWLYTYKTYRDIRLVMAPPRGAASFGGDYDNFTYPRYDLDFTLLRIYENGKPISSHNYFKLNPLGAKEGELIFVVGNPGKTQRNITFAEIAFAKEYIYPSELDKWTFYLRKLKEFSSQSTENKRKAASTIASFANTLKVKQGEYDSLKRDEVYNTLRDNEMNFIRKADPQLKTAYKDTAKCMDEYGKRYKELYYTPLSQTGKLPKIAKDIVQYVYELEKPNGERITRFSDANLNRFLFETLSEETIYNDFEELMLEASLEFAQRNMPTNSKEIQYALAGKKPKDRAKELIRGSRLANLDYRKQLLAGGSKGIRECNDPLIKLALSLKPYEDQRIEWVKNNMEKIMKPANEKIAKAKFAVYGKNIYPDATFTLRLTYGTVKGYPYNGTEAPANTTLYGMFDRYYSFLNTNFSEWILPDNILRAKSKMALETPVNFVYEADTIGGNSGSPVINRNMEFVGINFDRNTHGMVRKFLYDPTYARSVAVHSAVIVELLKKVYNDDYLLKELGVE